MKRLLQSPHAWVFSILFVSYAYFWQGRDWNSASRLMLTYAIVDRATISIDGTQDQTHDIAVRLGRHYTDKTPGFSLLGLPPYAAAKAIFRLPDHPLNVPGFAFWPADYWITLGTSGLLSALAGAILVHLAIELGCGPRRAALVGLGYGLATPAYAYATMAYGHQPAAFCLIAGFALLWKPGSRRTLARAFAAGFLTSYAAVIEIQVGPVSAILGVSLLAQVIGKRRTIRELLGFSVGAAIPALVLMVYNQQAFGSPFKMGYFFLVTERFARVHSANNPLGLQGLDLSKLTALLWGGKRGLIWYAPLTLLTPPGLILMAYRKLWGIFFVTIMTIIALFLVNMSYPEWTGGWTTGPRLLVPLLPFAMLPVAACLASGGRAVTAIALILAVWGGVVILLFLVIGARVPDGIEEPFAAAWSVATGSSPLPGWLFGNRFARNACSVAFPALGRSLVGGLGLLLFVPLVIFQVVAMMMMISNLRFWISKKSSENSMQP